MPCSARTCTQKEIRDIERDTLSGVTIEPRGTSIQSMLGCLKGEWEAGMRGWGRRAGAAWPRHSSLPADNACTQTAALCCSCPAADG